MRSGLALRLLGVLFLFVTLSEAFIPVRTVGEYRQNVIMSRRPVLVFFTTSWCGEPCNDLRKMVEKEARYHPNVILAQVDTDQLDTIARLNMVSNVPALVLFKNGKKAKVQIKYIDEYDVKYFFALAA